MSQAYAALIGWNDNSADWNTPAEWDLGIVPDTLGGIDDVAISTGTATYFAGPLGDFRLNSTMTVDGSVAFIQDAGTIAWMKIGDGFGNKITMLAYANPETKSYGTGYGLIRFDKKSREVTFECWPRDVDVTQDNAEQFPGWPRTAIVK